MSKKGISSANKKKNAKERRGRAEAAALEDIDSDELSDYFLNDPHPIRVRPGNSSFPRSNDSQRKTQPPPRIIKKKVNPHQSSDSSRDSRDFMDQENVSMIRRFS